jgi:hypothetical protein
MVKILQRNSREDVLGAFTEYVTFFQMQRFGLFREPDHLLWQPRI